MHASGEAPTGMADLFARWRHTDTMPINTLVANGVGGAVTHDQSVQLRLVVPNGVAVRFCSMHFPGLLWREWTQATMYATCGQPVQFRQARHFNLRRRGKRAMRATLRISSPVFGLRQRCEYAGGDLRNLQAIGRKDTKCWKYRLMRPRTRSTVWPCRSKANSWPMRTLTPWFVTQWFDIIWSESRRSESTEEFYAC